MTLVIEKRAKPDQKQCFYLAHHKVMDLYHVLNDMMSGPNPITAEEFRKLAKKRPEHADLFLQWAEKLDSEKARPR